MTPAYIANTYSVNIRYIAEKNVYTQYVFTKFGFYMNYKLFTHFCNWLKRIKQVDIKRADSMSYRSPVTTILDNSMMCTVAYDIMPNGTELFVNKFGSREHFSLQSARISGDTYDDMCGFMHGIMDFIHFRSGLPINSNYLF